MSTKTKLLSKDTSNAKLAKTHDVHGRDWETLILYMAPATVGTAGLAKDGVSPVTLCPASTEQCRAGCLFYAGRAAMFRNVNEARIRKTRYFVESQAEFLAQLRGEIRTAVRRATRAGKRLAIRLNGTTDIDWVKLGVVAEFPEVQFYDYTKVPTRAIAWARGELPSNYHLTFSRSESNSVVARRVLAAGGNVAVVIDESIKDVGVLKLSASIINGDLHDARFLDGKSAQGFLVLLKAKGKARKTASESGFVLTAAGLESFARETSNSVAA
jgi:hypothetical protein